MPPTSVYRLSGTSSFGRAHGGRKHLVIHLLRSLRHLRIRRHTLLSGLDFQFTTVPHIEEGAAYGPFARLGGGHDAAEMIQQVDIDAVRTCELHHPHILLCQSAMICI